VSNSARNTGDAGRISLLALSATASDHGNVWNRPAGSRHRLRMPAAMIREYILRTCPTPYIAGMVAEQYYSGKTWHSPIVPRSAIRMFTVPSRGWRNGPACARPASQTDSGRLMSGHTRLASWFISQNSHPTFILLYLCCDLQCQRRMRPLRLVSSRTNMQAPRNYPNQAKGIPVSPQLGKYCEGGR
jgi:hypothetical protein